MRVDSTSSTDPLRPVYFPLTFLPPAVIAALQAIFRSVAVVQPGPDGPPDPMQPFAASGFLEVLHPAGMQWGEAVLREMQRWGRQHHGGLGAAAAWRQERFAADALGADGTPHEIAAAIRRGKAGGGVPENPLHAAALFLQLAQDLDWQQHQVDRALSDCSRRHGRLFDAVSGKARPAAETDPLPAAVGSHLPERMSAWIRVFLATRFWSPVFVTHHAEAVEWLCERLPGGLRIALEALPGVLLPGPNPTERLLERGDLAALLDALARSPLTPIGQGPRAEVRLPAVHIWAETPPDVFLARIAGIDVNNVGNEGEPARHTLVVQMPDVRP
jgi:hypothetical protein